MMMRYMLVVVLAFSAMPQTAVSDPMDTMNIQEMGQILQSIAAPFSEIKEKRNMQMDRILGAVLKTFKPVVPALTVIQSCLQRLSKNVPAASNMLIPTLNSSLSLLSTAVDNVEHVMATCPDKLLVAAPNVADLSSLSDLLSSLLKGLPVSEVLPKITGDAEKEEGPQNVQKQHYDVGEDLNEIVDPAVVAELSKVVVCDETCQLEKIGAENADKHVTVKDAVQAFSYVLGAAMERHRVRYERLIPTVTTAGKEVTSLSGMYQELVSNGVSLGESFQDLSKKATGIAQAFITDGQKLKTALSRLHC